METHLKILLYQLKSLNPSYLALIGLQFFYASLVLILCTSKSGGANLFLTPHGRFHRIAGFAQLSWLIYGVILLTDPIEDRPNWSVHCLLYDFILGVLGTTTTLSAARDFPHKRIANRPGESGTLSETALVTQSEMIEHSFYQGLNFCQAMYLHVITWVGLGTMPQHTEWRFVALWAVTLPWILRVKFPVNSFSANWTAAPHDKTNDDQKRAEDTRIRLGQSKGKNAINLNRMYRIKKWQYLFYKHVILHGLNISVALSMGRYRKDELVVSFDWRVFWLCLNSSYVMEFFMQSLVKRGVLSQSLMLLLQWILMGSSSLAAGGAVLERVRFDAAFLSLLLNFLNRGHDVANTMLVSFLVVTVL